MRGMAAGELASYRTENRYMRADGGALWASMSMSFVADSVRPFFIVQMTDISERRAAQEAAQTSYEMFRSLTVASPSGVFSCDHRGHLDYCNERMRKITGRSRDELLDHGWWDIVDPLDAARVFPEMRRNGREERARRARVPDPHAGRRSALGVAALGAGHGPRRRDDDMGQHDRRHHRRGRGAAGAGHARGRVPDAGRELVGLPVAPRAGRDVSVRVAGVPGAEWLRARRARRRQARLDRPRRRPARGGRGPGPRDPPAGAGDGDLPRTAQGRGRALVRVDDHRCRRRVGRGRRDRRRHARHHRPQGRRAAAFARRAARLADRTAEPGAVPRPPRARAAPLAAAGRGACRPVPGPRPFQGRQRLARPRGRRPAADRRRGPDRRGAAPGRHGGALRRRRVHDPARRPRGRDRGDDDLPAARRRVRRAVRARRRRGVPPDEHRHRDRAAGDRDGRGADPRRRRGDVPRQGRGQGPLRDLRRPDARRCRRPAAHRERAAPRAPARRAATALPAGDRRHRTAGDRLRGAGALAAPHARPAGAEGVHPAGRGDGTDRADRRMGAARGVRRRGDVAAVCRRRAADAVGQPLGAPVPPAGPRRVGARGARGHRAPTPRPCAWRSPRAR